MRNVHDISGKYNDNVTGYVKSANRNSVLLHNSKEAGCNNLYVRDLDLQISLLFSHSG